MARGVAIEEVGFAIADNTSLGNAETFDLGGMDHVGRGIFDLGTGERLGEIEGFYPKALDHGAAIDIDAAGRLIYAPVVGEPMLVALVGNLTDILERVGHKAIHHAAVGTITFRHP